MPRIFNAHPPVSNTGDSLPLYRRAFFGFLKTKFRANHTSRPGALPTAVVKNTIEKIGVGGIAEIFRIGYDGELDDLPVVVKISGITKTGFSGKVISVEREMIEGNTERTVYAKRGGGIIEFNFDDGDIKEIRESNDYQEISEIREIGALVEVLRALEVKDQVLVAYFDEQHHGTVNFEGVLTTPLVDNRLFQIVIHKINGVNLDKPITKTFDILKEMVIDVALV